MFDIQIYVTVSGQEPYAEWLSTVPDRLARARILVRVGRMSAGHMGDVKPLGSGVWEARIDHGPGLRLYYAQAEAHSILLLFGGTKRQQQKDIAQAKAYWTDWQQRRKRK